MWASSSCPPLWGKAVLLLWLPCHSRCTCWALNKTNFSWVPYAKCSIRMQRKLVNRTLFHQDSTVCSHPSTVEVQAGVSGVQVILCSTVSQRPARIPWDLVSNTQNTFPKATSPQASKYILSFFSTDVTFYYTLSQANPVFCACHETLPQSLWLTLIRHFSLREANFKID